MASAICLAGRHIVYILQPIWPEGPVRLLCFARYEYGSNKAERSVPHQRIEGEQHGSFKTFVKRYSVPIYYMLTFVISWGGVLLAVGGPHNIPGTPGEFAKLIPRTIPAMLGGPAFAGLLMTGLVYGKRGYLSIGV